MIVFIPIRSREMNVTLKTGPIVREFWGFGMSLEVNMNNALKSFVQQLIDTGKSLDLLTYDEKEPSLRCRSVDGFNIWLLKSENEEKEITFTAAFRMLNEHIEIIVARDRLGIRV